MLRLRNTTGLPSTLVRQVVRWLAHDLEIKGFDVECRRLRAGRKITRICGKCKREIEMGTLTGEEKDFTSQGILCRTVRELAHFPECSDCILEAGFKLAQEREKGERT